MEPIENEQEILLLSVTLWNLSISSGYVYITGKWYRLMETVVVETFVGGGHSSLDRPYLKGSSGSEVSRPISIQSLCLRCVSGFVNLHKLQKLTVTREFYIPDL